MPRSGKKNKDTGGGEFSDGEGLPEGGGANKSSSYTSTSESRKWEPQESHENSRKNEKLKKWIEDIEADLSELKQDFNLEEAPSGFISEYAAWRRKNSLYIDCLLVVVLAVMAWYIAGMFSGNSPVPDGRPVPENDGACEKKIQALESRLGDIQGGIDGLTDWKKEIETWQHQSEGKMHVLHEQGYDTNTIVILVVVIIVFIVILVVMIMMRQMNLAVQNAVGRSQTMQAGQDPASRLLKTVQRDCAEEKTVCILYFSKQSKQFCVNLTKTVEPDTKKLRQCFLYSDSDIKTIPRSKVIIVYVEKNERNVILEDPDQELGNLRRTTVEAARIMGATVVVVYMHHDESRNLGKEELYCSALYSVTRHYVLSELEKEGAVLSVYDSFSDFQQKHLKELISKNV